MTSNSNKLPDGPQLPTLLVSLQTILVPLETSDAWQQQYGDSILLSNEDDRPVVSVCSPSALQTVFSSPELFNTSQAGTIMEAVLGSESLVVLEGDRHQRLRRLVAPAFHGEPLREYGQGIQRTCRQVFDALHPGQSIVMRPLLKRISLEIILRVVFGVDSTNPRFNELFDLLNRLFEWSEIPWSAVSLVLPQLRQDWGDWSPWGQFVRRRDRVRAIVQELIQTQRSSAPSIATVLGRLVAATDDSGARLSNNEIVDTLLTLVFAGYDTTTSALTWALYWAYRVPAVHHQLVDELRLCTDPDEIMRLPYLTAVCQESLRLYPVGTSGFLRVVKQPVTIDGYDLQPGAMVVPSIYRAHHRVQTWGDPSQFRPERFLVRTYSPYEFLPFGGGNRRCSGAAFALFEMKLVLATALTMLRLKPLTYEPLRPVRYGAAMAPPSDFKMAIVGARW